MGSPYLIICDRFMMEVVFLPAEGELLVDESRLRSRRPAFAWGADGMRYELELEALPEPLQLGQKARADFDWWDKLCDWYDRWFCGGGHREVPVRYHLQQSEPYDYPELRAQVAGILRRDGDCYSQFGADTRKAAEHVDKTKNFRELMLYFARRKFLWLFCDSAQGKACRERLKEWCAR